MTGLKRIRRIIIIRCNRLHLMTSLLKISVFVSECRFKCSSNWWFIIYIGIIITLCILLKTCLLYKRDRNCLPLYKNWISREWYFIIFNSTLSLLWKYKHTRQVTVYTASVHMYPLSNYTLQALQHLYVEINF